MRAAFPVPPPRMDLHFAPLQALAHATEGGQRTLEEALEVSLETVRALLTYAEG